MPYACYTVNAKGFSTASTLRMTGRRRAKRGGNQIGEAISYVGEKPDSDQE
jgi:hypothetical protein